MGFPSNCFVCEPTNVVGLRLGFFHDVEAGLMVADIEFVEAHSGAPCYVHGGVQLALLDEAMAWAAIAIAGKFAVTASFSCEFHHPLKRSAYRLGRRSTIAPPRPCRRRLGSSTTRAGCAHRPRLRTSTWRTGRLGLRIGVGDADAGPVVDELVAELRRRRPADGIIRYVVGPTALPTPAWVPSASFTIHSTNPRRAP